MNEKKIYRGFRDPEMPRASGECMVFVNEDTLRVCPWYSGMTGPPFSWGYCGAGPRQLAASILHDYLNADEDTISGFDKTGHALDDDFMNYFLADLPYDVAWTITSDDIERFLDKRGRS